MLTKLQISAIVAIGLLAAFYFYVADQKKEAVEAALASERQKAFEQTEKEIASISDRAERARVMRAFCASNSLRYDFANVKCIK